MPWEYLEEEAIADIGIRVTANDLNSLFNDSCMSICHLMTDLDTFEASEKRSFDFEAADLVRLLYELMEELLILKDADLFFVKEVDVKVSELEDGFKATAEFTGGEFDREIHHIGNDIKSITYHDFYIKEANGGWEAHFIIDI